MSGAPERLADWVSATYAGLPFAEPLTHLKLQKLVFYTYGYALAAGHDNTIGEVGFEPWEHGPVSRAVWMKHRSSGRRALPVPTSVQDYEPGISNDLRDVIRVYGRLSAWNLREQSHLEAPWIDAWQKQARSIPREAIRTHFKSRFSAGRVLPPEYLLNPGSFQVDGIPYPAFASLGDMADQLDRYLTT